MADQDQGAKAREDELLIEVVPDEADGLPAEQGAEAAAAAPKVVTAEEGIAELRARLEASDREKEAAAARARDAETRAEQAGREAVNNRGSAIDSAIGQVNGAIETMTGKMADAKREYATALREQDFEKAAEIQATMADYSVATMQLRGRQQFLEGEKKKGPASAPRPAPAAANPVEAFASTLKPRDAAWVRAHPEFVTDPTKNKRLIAAHHAAVIDHEAGSDDYYAVIERQLGLSAAAVAPAPLAAKRAASVAAPPSRGTPSLDRAPEGQVRVRLTAAEVRMAEAQGMTAQEWAREKQKFAEERARGVTEH